MKAFEILVRPLSPLLIGGYSAPSHGGDRSGARDERGRPMIPASALRGALRIELERLLRGRDGDDAACSANVALRAGGGSLETRCDCPVCRLFGIEGEGSGLLRLEDAVLPEEAGAAVTVRSQVGVSRTTRSAVPAQLAFMEALEPAGSGNRTPALRASGRLVPRGTRDTDLDDDLRNLRAACRALTGLGGGKARGLGWVECELRETEEDEPRSATAVDLPSGVRALRVSFTAEAPLHFGAGRPLGAFHPTRTSAPGSTVRGALAFALLEHGLCRPDEAVFQELVTPAPTGASFGTARAPSDVPLATRRRCRPHEHIFDDLLGELLRRQAARCGVALTPRGGGVCPVGECRASKATPWPWTVSSSPLRKRLRTRTAINRKTGTAMDQKLYSMEVLEPAWAPGAEDDGPVTLTAEVRRLSPSGAELLAGLDGREVWLGGRKSRGMGLCRVDVEALDAPEPSRARRHVDRLTRAFKKGWGLIEQGAGDRLEVRPLGPDDFLLALVLEEPWLPDDPDLEDAVHRGPLLPDGDQTPDGVKPFQSFLTLTEHGRFGAREADRHGAPESVVRGEAPPETAVGAGSVYVYRVTGDLLEARLEDWVEQGFRGVGPEREIGFGRFRIRGVHDPDAQDEQGGTA